MLNSAICKQKSAFFFGPKLCTIDIRYMKCRNCEADLYNTHGQTGSCIVGAVMEINVSSENGLNRKLSLWKPPHLGTEWLGVAVEL
jgi:hypothetical protein